MCFFNASAPTHPATARAGARAAYLRSRVTTRHVVPLQEADAGWHDLEILLRAIERQLALCVPRAARLGGLAVLAAWACLGGGRLGYEEAFPRRAGRARCVGEMYMYAVFWNIHNSGVDEQAARRIGAEVNEAGSDP